MSEVVFEAVTFAYPDSEPPALDDVSLSVETGTFVLITGQTGSGKSTLLRAVNGLVPHFSGGTFQGRVLVAGRDTQEASPRSLSDVVAFVPQEPSASFVVDRVEDELAYAMENLAVPAPTMRRRVEEVLDLLALAPLRDRSVRTLSGGERQRVAIAAALTPGASVIALDEPTSQLDPQGAEDVLAALQRLAHDLGITVLCAEHRLERVAGFADIVLACERGRVAAGEPGSVLPRLDLGPPVSRLGVRLGWDPVPLTVRGARRLIEHREALPADAAAAPHRAGDPDLPPSNGTGSSFHAEPPLAQMQGVSVDLGGRRVLRSVDLELGPGQVVAVMGRNGAGKTTLLRSLAGLQAPHEGMVRVTGATPVPGRNTVMCPQDPEVILFEETVRAEVMTTLRRSGGGRAEAMAWLERAGLDASSERHPRDLSVGERVMLAIVCVVAAGCPLILLDEPTRGLDQHRKESLRALLSGLAADGRCIVVATHDAESVASFADTVVLLAEGEVIAHGAPREHLAHSAVFSSQIARVSDGRYLTVEEAVAALGPP